MAVTIKICGIQDPETATHALALGVDWLGVVMTPSVRQISPVAAERLIREAPGSYVAVAKDVPEALFEELLRLPVRAIQLHGQTPGDWVTRVHAVDKWAIATRVDSSADVILLDNPEPGQGTVWRYRKPAYVRQPVWLAGGLRPQNVRDVVRRIRPDGVDVSSGVENYPGHKDGKLIEKYIEEVRYGEQEAFA